jgi:hypothetical protein
MASQLKLLPVDFYRDRFGVAAEDKHALLPKLYDQCMFVFCSNSKSVPVEIHWQQFEL